MRVFRSTVAKPFEYVQDGLWRKGIYTYQAFVKSAVGYAFAFQYKDLTWEVFDCSWQLGSGFSQVEEVGFELKRDAIAFKLIANPTTGEILVGIPMLEDGTNKSTPIAHEEDLRGMDGDFHEFIFTRNDTGIAPPTPLSTQENDHVPIDDSVEPPVIWTDNPQGVTKELPFEFVSMREKKNGVWLNFSPPSLWAKWAEDGFSLSLQVQGHFVSHWEGIEKVTEIVGGEYIDDEEVVKVTAVVRKGEKDVTVDELQSRGFRWYVNGFYNPACDNQSYITLDGTYGDGFADFVILSYLVNSLREEVQVEVMNLSDGMDGIGEESIFIAHDSEVVPPELPQPTDAGYQEDDYHGHWSDDPVSPTKVDQFVWTAKRKKVGGIWEAFGVPSVWTRWVEDGKDAIPPIIIDGYWAFWNEDSQSYIKSSFSAEGDDGYSPYVDDVTGTWWQWSSVRKEYEDTGIKAEGKDGEDAIPPIIIEGYWAFWNDTLQDYEKSSFSAVGDDGYSPYVNNITGTWWQWSSVRGEYEDTGIKAEGKDGEDGITIISNQQGHTYRADLNGAIIGSLANGMVELTITSGSTPITCPSATSGGTPTTNGTYRVTRTLGNGITTNSSLSGGKYRITPATLTVDEASVELEIKIMMGGAVTSYPLTLTYQKQFDGADGKSTEFIFKGSISDTTAPTLPSTSQQDDWYGQGTSYEWNDDLVEPTKTLPYVWASQRKKVDGVWGAFTPPKVWLRWTEDGDGITSTTIEYAKSSVGTTPPSDGWGTSIPEATQGWYLWTRTTTTYKVAETTVSYSVSHWAEDGDGIVSTTIEYAKSSSGTTIPSDWSTTFPTPTKGMYLWARTTTVYKKSPTTVAYATSYWAEDGDDAKSITLSANATKITVGKGNISSPTQINVKATAVNTTVETWEYSTDGGAFTATKPSFVTVVSTTERTISSSTSFKTITLRASRVADEASGIITISREGGAPYVDSTTRTWWEWSYVSNLYVDTGMSPVGSDGVIPYPAGYYDNTKRYRREAEYAPYVQYEGKLYLLIKDTPNAGIATSNTTYWKVFNHWEAVFVDSLVAAFAKIGGAVFTGDTSEVASGIRGRLISEMGENGTTTYANYTGDAGSWQPNIMLDFRTGKVKFANADIVGHITATSGSIGGVTIENETLSVATPTTNGILSSSDKAYIEQLKDFFEYDAGKDAIRALKPLYSTSAVSAYGLGSGGSSGGGGGISKIPSWAGYTSAMVDYYVSAGLLVPFYNDIRSRVANLEGGATPTQHTHVIGDITGLQTALNDKASSTHSHSWSQITSKPSTFAPSAHTLGSHSDVTITSIASGEILKWDGTKWINNTLSEAGISASTHSHSWSQITSKPTTFTPSTHSHTKSQITDFPTTWAWGNLTDVPSSFAPSSHSHSWSSITSKPSTFTPSAHTLGSHSDVTITSIASGEILKWDGTKWINNTLSEAGISASSHSHSWSQITGKPSTFAPSTHTHTSAQISDATNLNTASMIVKRDSSGNFSAGTITASLSGNASTATTATNCSRSIVAGDGLTGGGKLDANRTLTLGTPSSITLSSTNSVGTSNHAHSLALGGTTSQYLNGATKLVTIPTITAGNGLSGGGQLTQTRTVTLGTPSTLTSATTNSVGTASHTHAITTTTVGAVSTIVATDASGGIRGNIIRIGANWTLELSGTELVFKYSGVIKQRMLSNGTILGTGGVTAFATN